MHALKLLVNMDDRWHKECIRDHHSLSIPRSGFYEGISDEHMGLENHNGLQYGDILSSSESSH